VPAVRGRRILIVEDEYLLARDLSEYFTSLGAVVLGPASSVMSAGEHIEHADAAVLDIDLNGQKVFPVADELMRRGTPFVFFSGRGDISIPARLQHAGRLDKPVLGSAVLDTLFPIKGNRPSGPRKEGQTESASRDDVFAILPKLRLAALFLVGDMAAADRMVELTLERAVASLETREIHLDAQTWLTKILEDTYERFGRDLMM
jgi:CheY-like chemotaxis protein